MIGFQSSATALAIEVWSFSGAWLLVLGVSSKLCAAPRVACASVAKIRVYPLATFHVISLRGYKTRFCETNPIYSIKTFPSIRYTKNNMLSKTYGRFAPGAPNPQPPRLAGPARSRLVKVSPAKSSTFFRKKIVYFMAWRPALWFSGAGQP
jgi:hypothetical protein